MIPVVALIGRPNVGKSTLFNRLTSTNDAIVADFSELTRDRKYGHTRLANNEFIVIDTGGIDGDIDEGIVYEKQTIKNNIIEQSLIAINEADIVLFILDSRSGLISVDISIAKYLRSINKHTVIVVNKIDGIDDVTAIVDFYVLGMGDILPISAVHGIGINKLKKVLISLVEKIKVTENKLPNFKINKSFEQEQNPLKLAIVGRPNVGKSTLINCFTSENRVIVSNMPDTTRDSIYIPMKYEDKEYILIDTAGIKKRSKLTNKVKIISIIKTIESIAKSNVVLMIIDASECILDLPCQDLSLLNFIMKNGKSLVIVVNKCDLFSDEKLNKIKNLLSFRLKFIDFVRVHFISALYDNKFHAILVSVNEAYQGATKKINTALITNIMHMAINNNQPPIISGQRIKLKYAHIGGYNPPLIVIHGTKVKSLPNTYQRYLTKFFMKKLNIKGTPIRIKLNNGCNPYFTFK